MPEHVSNASIQERVLELTARLSEVAADVSEIKSLLKDIEGRVRKLEHMEAGSHPLLENRLDVIGRRVGDNEQRLETLVEIVFRLEQANRIITWLGGIVGSAVLVWLVTQILMAVR